ncbi:MAG: UDP-2,4-diacetamido-2,4,6-trideoxy-beta-L-altropyranose hydrolase [Sedimenticola sp.]
MHVVFRVDASISMGIGHVMRCLTLAEVLKRLDVKTTFITRMHQGNIADEILVQGHEVLLLPELKSGFQRCRGDVAHAAWLGVTWEQDAEETISAINGRSPDWLVVDHYALDARWHRSLCSQVGRIFVIDDLADRDLDCDLLLDQTYGRDEKVYHELIHKRTRVLTGSHYALLRQEFAEFRSHAIERRKHYKVINRILISMGGTDPRNATITALKGIKRVSWAMPPTLDVVLGSKSPCLESVKRMVSLQQFNATISTDASNMAERMLEADIAIGAAGTTTWERCCLGLPTVTICMAENQSGIARGVSKAGASIDAGDVNQIAAKDIQNSVQLLVDDIGLATKISERCFLMVDGQGAARVAECMVSAL